MSPPPHGQWPAGRRVFRFMVVVTVAFFAVPLVAGVALAATFSGWTSVAVAAVFWIAFVVVGLLVSRFAFRTFRPIRELVTAAGRLADGDYSARVAATGSPAIRPVVESFNQMADRLEVSDDLRRRLLADVGHELRTPLTIVRGELEAMADGVRELNEGEVRRLLGDIDGMERLLDDLRTLSMTEAGMVELDQEPTDLADLAADVAERFADQAVEQSVGFELKAETNVTAFVDPYRIGQVMTNLVVNALRAADAGDTITITTRRRADPERGEFAVVEVRDTGAGIGPDRIDAVFDRFHKGADSAGSGLGLTISRDLVEAHGGTVELESELGVGTRVTVTLPADRLVSPETAR